MEPRIAGGLPPAPADTSFEADSWQGNRLEESPEVGQNAGRYLKETLKELDESANEEIAQARQSALVPLLRALKEFVLAYVEERKGQGKAEFHDLLVWARDLLRDNIEVRDHFRSRFSHLLIDEAQDTDPIQAEIAMFLAEDVPAPAAAGGRPTDWARITPEVGKLFVVGDPKQSIYRFRRADARQMALLRERLGGETVHLVQNFRSQEPIVDWVNCVFASWMAGGNDQAEYVDLVHRWEVATDDPFKPRAWSLAMRWRATSMRSDRRRHRRLPASWPASTASGRYWTVRPRIRREWSGTGRRNSRTHAS